MRELYIDTMEAPGEDGAGHSFQYFILVDQMEMGDGLVCESYGVKAVSPTEEAAVPNITVSAARIDELIELLKRNAVSPTQLRDVVDDWL